MSYILNWSLILIIFLHVRPPSVVFAIRPLRPTTQPSFAEVKNIALNTALLSLEVSFELSTTRVPGPANMTGFPDRSGSREKPPNNCFGRRSTRISCSRPAASLRSALSRNITGMFKDKALK